MKKILILPILLLSLTAFAHRDFDGIISVDTLKSPEGRELTKKEQRLLKRQGNAVQRGDFTLSTTKKKADDLYQNLAYMEAVDLYEQLEGVEMNEFVMGKMANSYRLNGDFEEAEYYYSQMINDTENAEDFLHYAQVLQSTGKCEDAVRWYGEYLTRTMDKNREFILDCDELEDFKVSEQVKVVNLIELNTEDLDFSPVQYKNGLVFTSNRGTDRLAVARDKWTKDHFTDLFFAKVGSNGNIGDIESMGSEINGKFHDGVATFNRAGTMMIFSRSNKKGRSKEGTKDLKLYSASKTGDAWDNVVELNINSAEYASCHPTLSADGRRLYFTSDRPGGYGGMDIYVSRYAGGKWLEPENLGPMVNTSGNEIFPHIAQDETLYFASNGFRGIGGLDMYAIKKSDVQDETTWSIRENLGEPFNSKKDDFGFTMNQDMESGYFTSNRVGGVGGDDIYKWEGKLNEDIAANTTKRACVYDEATGERLPDVEVTVIETTEKDPLFETESSDMLLTLKPLNNENKEYVLSIVQENNEQVDKRDEYTTNQQGTFRYKVNEARNYIMVVDNPTYEPVREQVSGVKWMKENEYCITVRKRNCVVLDGNAINKKYKSAVPNAKIYLFNKCTGETEEVMSDADGLFNFCLDCDCDYEIVGQKENFSEGRATVSTRNIDCMGSIDAGVPLAATVELEVGDFTVPRPGIASGGPGNYPYEPGVTNPTYIFATPDISKGFPFPGGFTPENLNRYFLGTDNPAFKEGQVIKLSNIYYDFDKYNIREDASRELDYVYQLLVTYPSMHISLMSHTDSRGTDGYNERLARNRANSAMQYLLNRGISAHRLTKEGVGERQHVNRCANGVKCDELEHQMNRRTEIKITRFSEPGVQVEN